MAEEIDVLENTMKAVKSDIDRYFTLIDEIAELRGEANDLITALAAKMGRPKKEVRAFLRAWAKAQEWEEEVAYVQLWMDKLRGK